MTPVTLSTRELQRLVQQQQRAGDLKGCAPQKTKGHRLPATKADPEGNISRAKGSFEGGSSFVEGADLSRSRREGSAARKMEEVQARGKLPLRLACSPLTRLSHLRITSPPAVPNTTQSASLSTTLHAFSEDARHVDREAA